jgi:hypothetical protein
MPAGDHSRRGAGLRRGLAGIALLALAVGSAWGALTVLRQDRQLLQRRIEPGRSASIASYMRSAGVGDYADLLAGVAESGLQPADDLAFVVPMSDESRQARSESYYLVAYALAPRRVWLIAWCEPPTPPTVCAPYPPVTDLEAELRARGLRHALLPADAAVGLRLAARREIASLALVEFP